jgi:hypothetical protein
MEQSSAYELIKSPISVLAFIITIYIIYCIIQYTLLPKPAARIGLDTNDISTVIPNFADSNTLSQYWKANPGATILFYVNLQIKDRTAHSGNESANLVTIGNGNTAIKLNILISPDAGRYHEFSPASLSVLTDESTRETIDLPNIPLQTWVGIAIVQTGRKFNYYVNGKLVVSYLCDAVPTVPSGGINTGDKRLGGTLALMSLSSRAMTTDEIRSMYYSTVDATGTPYLSSGMLSFMPLPSLTAIINPFCPGGNCGSSASVGPYAHWNSSYPS